MSEQPLETVVHDKVTYERWAEREPVLVGNGLATLGNVEISSVYSTGETRYRFWGLTPEEFAERVAESRSLARRLDAAVTGKRVTKRDDEWWDAYEQGRLDGMAGKNQRRTS